MNSIRQIEVIYDNRPVGPGIPQDRGSHVLRFSRAR